MGYGLLILAGQTHRRRSWFSFCRNSLWEWAAEMLMVQRGAVGLGGIGGDSYSWPLVEELMMAAKEEVVQGVRVLTVKCSHRGLRQRW